MYMCLNFKALEIKSIISFLEMKELCQFDFVLGALPLKQMWKFLLRATLREQEGAQIRDPESGSHAVFHRALPEFGRFAL